MNWTELYPDKSKRPGIDELSCYFSAGVMSLFSEFSNYLAREYGMNCAPAVYTAAHGWTFRFGRNNMYLLKCVIIENGCFNVEGIRVKDKDSLNKAVSAADKLYSSGFKEKYAIYTAEKIAKQGERTKRRLEREKKEIEEMAAIINKDRFNKYRWAPKVPRKKIIMLYESDAKMIYDDDLADDVGYTLFARCLQGKEERLLFNLKK